MRKLSVIVVIVAVFITLVGCGGSTHNVSQYVGGWTAVELQYHTGDPLVKESYTVTESSSTLSINSQASDNSDWQFSTPVTSNGTFKFIQTVDSPTRAYSLTWNLHKNGDNLVGTLTWSLRPGQLYDVVWHRQRG